MPEPTFAGTGVLLFRVPTFYGGTVCTFRNSSARNIHKSVCCAAVAA